MPTISAAQLAAMQATVNSALDVTFTWKRSTQSQGPTKNVIDTFANVGGGTLIGNLTQPSPQLLQNYDYRVGAQATWLVRVAAGTDLRVADQLTTPDGQKLDVQIILHPRSYETAVQALAAEVK